MLDLASIISGKNSKECFKEEGVNGWNSLHLYCLQTSIFAYTLSFRPGHFYIWEGHNRTRLSYSISRN